MNYNYINTMNNNNDNNTMNDSGNDSTNNCNIDSSSILIAEAVLSTPAQKHQPGSSSALYKLAARNLRQHHGVPSMTALKLEKTVALLGLAPRRIVVQGLAPRRLLKGGKGGSSPLASAGEISHEGKENLREAETGAMMDDNLIDGEEKQEQEEEEEEEVGQEGLLASDDSNSKYDDNGDSIDNIGDDTKNDVEDFKADRNGKAKRPIHAALVAGGINLRPGETRPLLRALGVSPHRLVKLGLVTPVAVRAMPGRGGGGSSQHVRAGGPHKAGVGEPRGPPHGPPHARGCGPSSGCGSSRPMHGPPRRPFHGAGHHTTHAGGESEEEGVPSPLGPRGGPGHRGLRHQGGCLQGPPHGPGQHSMPIVRHGRGPPGGGKHGHGHSNPPHGHGHGHRHGHGHNSGGLHGEGEGEGGGERLRGEARRGSGQHGPRRDGEGMGRPRGPPHARAGAHCCNGLSSRCGPPGPMHGPSRPFPRASHHTMHPGEESEEDGMHRGPRHHGGGGGGGGGGAERGRSRGRPQGPPQGPVHGPFHGLFHEGASGAPPGVMAHPHHSSSSREGCGMKQRGGRHGGGTGFCGRRCGGSGGGGGGGGGGSGGGGGDHRQHSRMAHLAMFDGGHQPQLEAY